MSSLAKILLLRGKEVSGSDMQSSEATDELVKKGVKVYIGQKAENIEAEMPAAIVKTEAVSENNPEIVAAARLGIPA